MSDSETDELRFRMREIRSKLPQDVDDIVTGAKELTDWKHYVRAFPWGSLAGALAVGYFAVPRKLEVVRPDAATLEQLAKRQRLVIEPTGRVEKRPGLIESAMSAAGLMILRAGLAYAGQRAGVMFSPAATPTSSRERTP